VQISNRSLLLLLVAAVALVSAAVWLTLRPPAPPSEMTEEEVRATVVDEPPDVKRSGGSDWKPQGPVTVTAAEGSLVKLDCDGLRKERRVSEGVASFDQIPPAGCYLSLVPPQDDDSPAPTDEQDKLIPFYPLLPGDNVTCRREKVDVACDGSLAQAHAATLVAWSQGPGVVKLDGEEIGEVPIEDYKVPVGQYRLQFEGERARSSSTLTVRPDEFIEILFHSPTRDDTELPRKPDNLTLTVDGPGQDADQEDTDGGVTPIESGSDAGGPAADDAGESPDEAGE